MPQQRPGVVPTHARAKKQTKAGALKALGPLRSTVVTPKQAGLTGGQHSVIARHQLVTTYKKSPSEGVPGFGRSSFKELPFKKRFQKVSQVVATGSGMGKASSFRIGKRR